MTDSRTTDPRLKLPAAPQPGAPFRFPVVAATVPIVASLAIWLITGSVFALIFAGLGPLAATGSYIDSRVSARKKLRTETKRFARDVATTRSAIDSYHLREISDLAELTPPAIFLVRDVQTDSSRWMREPRDVLPVHLGYGVVRSRLALDGAESRDRTDSSTDEQYQKLTDRAASLHGAPIAVNARLGIAVFGNEVIALSIARALAIQLAHALSPATTWVRLRGVFSEEPWGSHLPHRQLHADTGADGADSGHERASVNWGQLGDDAPTVSITVVQSEQQIPSGHRVVIRAGGEAVAVVSHPDKHQRRGFDPSFLGREQGLVWALAAHEIASRDGLATNKSALPDSLEFGELLAQLDAVPVPRRMHSLASRPAVGVSGRVVVDLVTNGPHAIVGGTTGSGKSELLISWILAMAAESSPDDVTFLLVDFKGGSAFAHLAALPHTVGIITDLDETKADRAFSSLRAELRNRERALAQAGARDISLIDDIPRLVIVVDEFAAMMADYPQLHALFSDIAARGRSLGVHLILCTQRPSGVVRDALLANADLRVSLRVNNGADSSAVIGSDRAAELPALAKGRAWIAHGSSSAELVQFALATPGDVDAVAERWPGRYHPRRPWCEPLAEYIPLTAVETLGAALVEENAHGVQNSSRVTNVHDEPPALGGPTVMFGMSDLPDEQRHGVAEWSPSSDGHVLIIGAPGSGKSAAIATIAEVSSTDETGKRPTITNASAGTHTRSKEEDNVIVVDGGQEPARFWDILAELHTRLDAAEPRTYPQRCTLVTIDDLDAIISRFEDDHRVAVIDRLARLLREGPRRNLWVVASAQRITPAIHALAELMPHTLRLRFGSRQDFMLSGGSSVDYNPALPPGGGLWKGVRVQVALGESRQPVPTPAHVTTVRRSESLVIATTRPGVTTAACTAAGWNVRALRGGPGTERELLISDTDRPIALIGTVEEWQSRWGALVIAGANATVLLDGCSLSDYRQLTHTRELPPPLVSGSRQYWRVTEGGADRVLLPDEADHENDGW